MQAHHNVAFVQLIMALFRKKMAHSVGQDVPSTGYQGIIDLTWKLNSGQSPRETQLQTVAILRSLFPSWLPWAFAVSQGGGPGLM